MPSSEEIRVDWRCTYETKVNGEMTRVHVLEILPPTKDYNGFRYRLRRSDNYRNLSTLRTLGELYVTKKTQDFLSEEFAREKAAKEKAKADKLAEEKAATDNAAAEAIVAEKPAEEPNPAEPAVEQEKAESPLDKLLEGHKVLADSYREQQRLNERVHRLEGSVRLLVDTVVYLSQALMIENKGRVDKYILEVRNSLEGIHKENDYG